MSRRAVALGALALSACVQQTELLGGVDLGPTQADLALACPLAIDVFGASDTLLAPGLPQPSAASEQGYFSPGTADYDATLAGRLQAELSTSFSGTFMVRSCGSAQQWLSSLTPLVPATECSGASAPPNIGKFATACTRDPAPFVILVAAEPYDRCHGGGPGHGNGDSKPDTYASEFADRIDAFLAARKPAFLLLGAQTEWTPAPDVDFPYSCFWTLGDWCVDGVRRWRDRHPQAPAVEFVEDRHAEFKHRSACCGPPGSASCANASPHFVEYQFGGGNTPGAWVITAEGAARVGGLWEFAVSGLLTRRFNCAPAR